MKLLLIPLFNSCVAQIRKIGSILGVMRLMTVSRFVAIPPWPGGKQENVLVFCKEGVEL